MKILLVSDSHGDDHILKQIMMQHPDCDFYLHAGDSQSDAKMISPFVSVRGNCDYFGTKFEKSYELDTPFGKLYMEHIPFYQMSMSDLKSQNIKIYICGHTHVKKYEVLDGIHFINPGSLSYPRDGSRGYALLTINNDNIDVKFFVIK